MLVKVLNEDGALVGLNTQYVKTYSIDIIEDDERHLTFKAIFEDEDGKTYNTVEYMINKMDLNFEDLEKGFLYDLKHALLNSLLSRANRECVSENICEDIYMDYLHSLSYKKIIKPPMLHI